MIGSDHRSNDKGFPHLNARLDRRKIRQAKAHRLLSKGSAVSEVDNHLFGLFKA